MIKSNIKIKVKTNNKIKYVMTDEDYLFMGNYFKENENDVELMEKYYKMGAKLGNGECYFNLGVMYEEYGEFEKMEICYKKAGRRGISNALNNLGIYYKRLGDFDGAINYLKKAVKQDNVTSMHNLGKIYWELCKFSKMKKYYYMAGKKGYCESLRELGLYFHDCEENFKLGQIYLSWAITAGIFGNNPNQSLFHVHSEYNSYDDNDTDDTDDYYEEDIDPEYYMDSNDTSDSDCDCIYCSFSHH